MISTRSTTAALPAVVAICLGLAASGCAGTQEDDSRKILVTRGAYRVLHENPQASAVFVQDAHKAPQAELICERILMAGKRIRTLCYAREEEAARIRDHRTKFQELTTIPGTGG